MSVLLTAILWVPVIINRLFEHGIVHGIMDPDGKTDSNVGWANRLMAAHVNAVENLVVFAPLVIILHVLGMSTELTVFASSLYFFSRLAHAIVFALRTPIPKNCGISWWLCGRDDIYFYTIRMDFLRGNNEIILFRYITLLKKSQISYYRKRISGKDKRAINKSF